MYCDTYAWCTPYLLPYYVLAVRACMRIITHRNSFAMLASLTVCVVAQPVFGVLQYSRRSQRFSECARGSLSPYGERSCRPCDPGYDGHAHGDTCYRGLTHAVEAIRHGGALAASTRGIGGAEAPRVWGYARHLAEALAVKMRGAAVTVAASECASGEVLRVATAPTRM